MEMSIKLLKKEVIVKKKLFYLIFLLCIIQISKNNYVFSSEDYFIYSIRNIYMISIYFFRFKKFLMKLYGSNKINFK